MQESVKREAGSWKVTNSGFLLLASSFLPFDFFARHLLYLG